jgi:TRAP-type uncharacterized transport system fused permease subunit
VEVAAPHVDPTDVAAAPGSESPLRRLSGHSATLATMLCTGLALYSLYWVVGIVQPLVYRSTFLLVVLVLSFLLYPATSAATSRSQVDRLDWLLAAASVAVLGWPLLTFDDFIYHAADP